MVQDLQLRGLGMILLILNNVMYIHLNQVIQLGEHNQFKCCNY